LLILNKTVEFVSAFVVKKKEGKAIPLTGHGGPYVC
jgi:hypothetical protein